MRPFNFNRLAFLILTGLLAVMPPLARAQTLPVRSGRFEIGSSTILDFRAFVIPLDFQTGVQPALIPSVPVSANAPWYEKIPAKPRYVINTTGVGVTYPAANAVSSPVAAFGSGVNGSPLYLNQFYRFALYCGGQSPSTDVPDELALEVYERKDFDGGAAGHSPVFVDSLDLPHLKDTAAGALTADWTQFGEKGYQKTFTTYVAGTKVMETVVQFALASAADRSWGVAFTAPLMLTHRAFPGAEKYYFVVSQAGVVAAKDKTSDTDAVARWMAVFDPSNPRGSGAHIKGYGMNFEPFPAWGSVLLKTPNFQGTPAPPAYYGKTAEEIEEAQQSSAHRFEEVITLPLPASATAFTELGQTPELQPHTRLDTLVSELGNDPMAIANYVHNEIGLTDALGYNETGHVEETAVNAGGMNRGALGTYLEGQGSPEEQCALLVYMLRKAGCQAGYVKPPHTAGTPSVVQMLDERLGQLLHTRIKGEQEPSGATPVPKYVGVNYPWVALYLPDNHQWVHLFPWLKDTEVVEGLNVEGFLPPPPSPATPSAPVNGHTDEQTSTSIRQWSRNFLLAKGDSPLWKLDPEDHTIANIFVKDVQNNLLKNWPGISMDDLGVRFRNRRHNRTQWEQFPQPPKVSAAVYTVSDKLRADNKLYDTLDITITSVQHPANRKIEIKGLRTMDLHNRRAVVFFSPVAGQSNSFTLKFQLEAFDLENPDSGQGAFAYAAADPFLRQNQAIEMTMDNTDKEFTFSVTYHRHQAYMGPATALQGIPGDWISFLGIAEEDHGPATGAAAGTPIVSIFKLGDLNAFCLNAGRVTDKMMQVHLEPFWKQQQDQAANPILSLDYDLIEGTTAYVMGMSYYQRCSRAMEATSNLCKISMNSVRAHGFSQMGALLDASGNPAISMVNMPNGSFQRRIRHVYPRLDMNFSRSVVSGYGDLRPDAGGASTVAGSDFLNNLAGVELSCLEDFTIDKYFKGSDADAVSTVNLIQRIQQDNLPGNDVIEMDVNNYLTFQDKTYTYGSKTKTLRSWAGENTWGKIQAAFSGWDKDLVRVYVTPGPVAGAKGVWQGMGTLIIGRELCAALINLANGGAGGEERWGEFEPADDDVDRSPPINRMSIEMDEDDTPEVTGPPVSASPTQPHSTVFNQSAQETVAATTGFSPVTLPMDFLNLSDQLMLGTVGGLLGGDYAVSNSAGFILSGLLSEGFPIMGDNFPSSGFPLMAGDPVNMITGEMYADELDLSLPGPLPLQLRRNYGSQVLTTGEFGTGWKMAYFPYLFINDEGKIRAAEIDGSVVVYSRSSPTSQEWIVRRADNPMLSNGAGAEIGSVHNLFFNKITFNGSNTYVLCGADGSKRTYEIRSYPVYGSTYTCSRPYLRLWSDAVGNTLEFHFYGDSALPTDPWHAAPASSFFGKVALVKACNGNTMGFHYDPKGHIIDAYTGDGRHVSYRYDDEGDLREVTLPDGGWQKYDYLHDRAGAAPPAGQPDLRPWYSTHLICRETRPGGRIVETDYLAYQSGDKDEKDHIVTADKIGHASHLRRAMVQRSTVGKQAGALDSTLPASESYEPVTNATYLYQNTTDAQGRITGHTQIQDAYGRNNVYYYSASRLTRIADPLTHITDLNAGTGGNFKMQQEWYSAADVATHVPGAWEGALKLVQSRGGPLTTYGYDADGNLTGIQVTGDLDGVPETIETASTSVSYNDRHLPKVITRPHAETGAANGRSTWFTYDDGEHGTRPYFVIQVEEKDASGAVINRTTSDYEDVFTTDVNGNASAPFSKGLLHRKKVATGFAGEEALTEWTNSSQGFAIRQVVYSGQDQAGYPDAVTTREYNLRGEVVAEHLMDGAAVKKTNRYAYDDMGRRIWMERLDSTGRQLAWDYVYYNLTGDLEWTDSSRTNPEDYTFSRYDGVGRPVERTAWRSRARAAGTGVEAVPGPQAYGTARNFYNLFGDLVKTMDPLGNTARFTYDSIGRKVSSESYDGDWQAGGTRLAGETVSYDDATNSVTTTDARGGSTTIRFTATGKAAVQTNPDKTKLAWTYYLDGRPRKQPLSQTTWEEFTYDDAHYTVTKQVKNSNGSSLGGLQPAVTVTDRRGNVIRSTDMAGLVTSTSYDGLDRVMFTSVPGAGTTSAAQSTSHTYDAAGFYHRTVNALNEAIEVRSDALGRVVSTVVKAAGGSIVQQTGTSYSADFNSTTVTSGSGGGAIAETAWTDTAGHTVLAIHADGTYVTTTYDAAGYPVASSNETGQVTRTTYDGMGRVKTTLLPDGATTQFAYSYPAGGGQVVTRQMPGNLSEVVGYDSSGRLSSKYIQGASGTSSTTLKKRQYQDYVYFPETDAVAPGQLKRFTDPLNLSHSFTYDEWMRPSTTTIGVAGTAAYVFKEYLGYDARGMVTQLRETTSPPVLGSTSTFAAQVTEVDRLYDTQGHLYDEKVLLGASRTVVTHLTESFDAAGRRTHLDRGSAVASLGGSDSGASWTFGFQANGLLQSVSCGGGSYGFGYDDNGLLLTRTSPFRHHNITKRDHRGRILNTTTNLNHSAAVTSVLTESLAWLDDNKQRVYSATRVASEDATGAGTWDDPHTYYYSDQRRQLTGETYTPGQGQPAKAVVYQYDHNTPGGLGIRTLQYSGSGASVQGHQVGSAANPALPGWDLCARVKDEVSGLEKVGIAIQGTAWGAAGVELRLGAGILGGVSFPAATARTTGAWSVPTQWLPAGTYSFNAWANHPSGRYTGATQAAFVVKPSFFTVSTDYDEEGQTISRLTAGGITAGGRSQNLTWDGSGRLIRVVQDEPDHTGYEWSAVYDGFGRRIQTLTSPKVNSLPQALLQVRETSWYDPKIEFLEVGLEVSNASTNSTERWWKVHGPDLNGGYGGLQGIGGLESMINEFTGRAVGMIDDFYGHIIGFAKSLTGAGGVLAPASVTTSLNAQGALNVTPVLNDGRDSEGFPKQTGQISFEWNSARFTGYGPCEGSWSPSIEEGAAVWRTCGWHGKRREMTGFYHLGARYYEPNGGRFLSPDPMGHGASMSLYEYAGGDPVNFVDPEGRWLQILAGAAIGAVWGVAGQALSDWANHREFKASNYIAAGLGGAAGGAVFAATGSTALAGAAQGFVADATTQIANNGISNFNVTQSATATASGMVAGAVGGGLFNKFVPPGAVTGTGTIMGAAIGSGVTASLAGDLTHNAIAAVENQFLDDNAQMQYVSAGQMAANAVLGGGMGGIGSYAQTALFNGVASKLTPSGQGTNEIVGHGSMPAQQETFTVPEGTSLNFYAQEGQGLSSSSAWAIGEGLLEPVWKAGPGESIPDFRYSEQRTGSQVSSLSSLLTEKMGTVDCNFCLGSGEPGTFVPDYSPGFSWDLSSGSLPGSMNVLGGSMGMGASMLGANPIGRCGGGH